MTTPPSPVVPPGWYPDPAGERRWRVWTGTAWSDLTRPYGDRPIRHSIVSSLGAIDGLGRVLRTGIFGVLGGLALLVGTVAYGPSHYGRHGSPFDPIALTCAVTMILAGSLSYTHASEELGLRPRWLSYVPLVNLLTTTALVTRRLGGRPGVRLAGILVISLLYATRLAGDPWLIIAPALVALDQYRWTAALRAELVSLGGTLPGRQS
jgi:hypothetical protein